METGSDCGHSGNGGPMAPGWIPLVLERDFESSKARREKTDIERSSGSHLPNDGREPRLGSSSHPWRSSRWISSRCRRSPCPYSIASSSLATIAGVFCTATSRGIPRPCGLCSKLREAFPFDSAPRFLIFDRDAKYGLEVAAVVRSLNLCPVRTSFESPWQNGIAERWVGSCRRDLLDHVIAFNERHLKRLLCEYISYHHEDRTHLGLGKGTPARRICSANAGRVISHDRLGGLHHRYHRAA